MQTAQETWTFERGRAEVPHGAVAIALTEAEAETCCEEEPGRYDELDPMVERAKAGDSAALANLLMALRPRAMATAVKMLRNSNDAEDAVQEALVKIWRNLAQFEGRSSFSTWVHRIVRNASLDLLRRGPNRNESHPAAESQPGPSIEQRDERTPETELATREIQSLVRGAIAALPPLHRQAVELRDLEDHTYLEMAEIIRCPLGTVMSRLHHGRQRLAVDLRLPCSDSVALAAA
jgi:RNA polymerase sigma-70 factor (ECF subfamily)